MPWLGLAWLVTHSQEPEAVRSHPAASRIRTHTDTHTCMRWRHGRCAMLCSHPEVQPVPVRKRGQPGAPDPWVGHSLTACSLMAGKRLRGTSKPGARWLAISVMVDI